MSSQIERTFRGPDSHPLCSLSRDDLDLATELLLHSGSLKDLAAVYGVSYPTIRARVDRVIERLKAILNGKPPDPLTDLLASLVERGEMSGATARLVRDTARQWARSNAQAGTVAAPAPEASEIPDKQPPAATEPRRFDWKPRPA